MWQLLCTQMVLSTSKNMVRHCNRNSWRQLRAVRKTAAVEGGNPGASGPNFRMAMIPMVGESGKEPDLWIISIFFSSCNPLCQEIVNIKQKHFPSHNLSLEKKGGKKCHLNGKKLLNCWICCRIVMLLGCSTS